MHVLSSLKRCLHCNPLQSSFLRQSQNLFQSGVRGLRNEGSRNGRPFTGTRKATLTPTKAIFETPREGYLLPGLGRSLLFTAGFCTSVYITASIFHYERFKKKLTHADFPNWVASRWNSAEGWDHKEINFRKQLNRWWNDLPDGVKTFWAIFALNALVFGCWQLPALRLTMTRYFCTTPAAKAVCWPLVLSTFSHYTVLHFGMNMYVLHSFSTLVGDSLGMEQMVAFYLTGGVLSSFLSQAYKVALQSVKPSLGASGAIMACLAYVCINNPDAQLGIVFIPGFSFSAENAIKCVMALDAIGLIFRWTLFDHAGHLGGALFGIFYAAYGKSLIWDHRITINRNWQKLKDKFTH